MNTSLFKEPKFFQLEFIKTTVEMISKGCKFHVIGNRAFLYDDFKTLSMLI